MILTFSGTGNSRYAARILSEVTGDEIVDLKNRIKNGDASPITAERLILAVPTYAWRIPRVVEGYLHSVKLPAGCPVWYVMTCGGSIGGADALYDASHNKGGTDPYNTHNGRLTSQTILMNINPSLTA